MRAGAADSMPEDGVQLLSAELFEALVAKARASPRLRTNYNFHASMDENPHRFLNVMIRGTYVTPHRHRVPPKSESFVILEGEVAFFTFGDSGKIATTHILGRGTVGIDLQPGVWHTLAVLTPYAICYEVKPGPYSTTDDKEFAPWAPREGEPGVAGYLEGLISSCGR
jgi:cupin fold WbuC family metalloprotein